MFMLVAMLSVDYLLMERDRRERRCEKAITSLLVRKWARPAGRRAVLKHWPATVRPLPLHHQDPRPSQLGSVGLPRPPPALDRWSDLHQKPRRRKGEEDWQYTQMSNKAWVIWAGGISAFIAISPSFFISFYLSSFLYFSSLEEQQNPRSGVIN